MADDKNRKPITAAELKKEQEDREKANAERRVAEAKKQQEAAQQREQQERDNFVQGLRAWWRKRALEAAQMDGISFVVLADVVTMGPQDVGFLNEVIAEAQKDGFKMEIVSLQQPMVGFHGVARGRVRPRPVAPQQGGGPHQVSDGRVLGLHPGQVPHWGKSGINKQLIVRWR